MAEAKTTLMVVAEPEKAGGATREAAKEEAKRKRVRGGGAERDGAERLRQAADKRIWRISKVLTDLLAERAKKGDLQSAKTLMEWAGRKKPRASPKKKPRFPTYAQRLGAEPPYQERGREEGGVGTGSREQGTGSRD